MLRSEARAATVTERGGAALVTRDRPARVTDAVARAALAGAPAATVVVGTLDGMVVGYMLARAKDAEGSGRFAELLELWVTPEARKLGVGEAMMGVLTGWARETGCVELDATALPGDRDTKNFFEIHGLVARQIVVSRSLS